MYVNLLRTVSVSSISFASFIISFLCSIAFTLLSCILLPARTIILTMNHWAISQVLSIALIKAAHTEISRFHPSSAIFPTSSFISSTASIIFPEISTVLFHAAVLKSSSVFSLFSSFSGFSSFSVSFGCFGSFSEFSSFIFFLKINFAIFPLLLFSVLRMNTVGRLRSVRYRCIDCKNI